MASKTDNTLLEDYAPGETEAGKSYRRRLEEGFFDKYLKGRVLDVGYRGASNPENKTVVPNAIGVDLEYPGYNGITLPFPDASIDAVFSSHCLEHIAASHRVILDWYRVLKVGGFIVCMVPHQFLYEKRRFLPSVFNPDHKRFYTPAKLLNEFEEALLPNSYRVRHLRDNDQWFNYEIGPDQHSFGCYEIELVIEKIRVPSWEVE